MFESCVISARSKAVFVTAKIKSMFESCVISARSKAIHDCPPFFACLRAV